MRQNKNQKGFISMIVVIGIVVLVVIWLAYHHISVTRK